jgi:hypothetical protein
MCFIAALRISRCKQTAARQRRVNISGGDNALLSRMARRSA